MFAFAFLLLIVKPADTSGATITAASASRADVGTAYASAVAGDTVIIPAGAASWASTLTVQKGIKIYGSGMGVTILTNNITGTTGSDSQLFYLDGTSVTSADIEVGNFTIEGGTSSPGPWGTIFGISNPWQGAGRIRIGYVHFNDVQNASFVIVPYRMVGVIDHCIFTLSGTRQSAYQYGGGWMDGTSYGDSSWATPTWWGSATNVFWEDCYWNRSGQSTYAIMDGDEGFRAVVRNSVITNGWIEMHGTESAGRRRGARAVEAYKLTVHDANGTQNQLVDVRSGSALVFSNTVTGMAEDVSAGLHNYRQFSFFAPWGYADGTNAWDDNVAAGPFATGTHDGGNNTFYFEDSSKSWVVNEWVGYQIINTTKRDAGIVEWASYVTANTATRITFDAGFQVNMTFTNGHAMQLWRVNEALDQPGKGKGDQLSGAAPSPVWLNQEDEPVRHWQNSINGGAGTISAAHANIRAGEHYTNAAPAGYAPYQYPHPLVSSMGGGGGEPPAPTPGLPAVGISGNAILNGGVFVR